MRPTRRAFVLEFAASLGSAIGLLGLSSVAHADDADITGDIADETNADGQADPLDVAFAQLGKPYIWGSAAGRSYFGLDAKGWDCSGWCSWVYRVAYDTYLPASTSNAWRATVPTTDPQRGDLAFWGMQYASPRLQHMAIYLEDGQVIQAGGRRANVNIDSAWAIGTPSFRRLP